MAKKPQQQSSTALPSQEPSVGLAFTREAFDMLQTLNQKLERQNAALRGHNSGLRRVNKKLEREAMFDSLTGVFSRRYIETELHQVHARSQRRGKKDSYAVILFDIDKFKRVNDELGHAEGDTVLKQVGEKLRQEQLTSDPIGRWGGEEFVILLPGCTSLEKASKVADKIRAKFEAEPCRLTKAHGRRPLPVTLSFGVAVCDKESDHDATDVFNRADAALYRAKGKVKLTNGQCYDDPDETDARNRVCNAMPSGELVVRPRTPTPQSAIRGTSTRPQPKVRQAARFTR